MQSLLKRYVEAAMNLHHEGSDLADVLKNLREVMKKKGHLKLYSALLHALSREFGASDYTVPTLTVAKEEDKDKYQKEVKKKDVKVVIDPNITGGYIFTENFVRQDQSYRHKLLTLYKRAIAQVK